MRYIITLLLLLLSSQLKVIAQEAAENSLVLIHGIILDAESESEVSNAHISINRISSAVSDLEGKFSIYVYRGDTVQFSFLGYRDVTFVTDTLPGRSYVAGIFMQRDTMLIGEVIIHPRMGDLKTEFMNSDAQRSSELQNAQNNLIVSTYQGINSSAELGDPGTNYDLLRRRQTINAYEKGGIPSDQMMNLNVISLIPATIYILANGLPEKPPPPKPHVSYSEIEKMKRAYRESLKQKKED